MRKYEKGRRHEYRAKEWWEREGAFVVRAAGSKGIADLVAVKNSQAYLIQVKVNKKPNKQEFKLLTETAARCGAFGVVMVWNQRKRRWEITEIDPLSGTELSRLNSGEDDEAMGDGSSGNL